MSDYLGPCIHGDFYLFFLQGCHLGIELLVVLCSSVVCELLLHFSHDFVLQLQTESALLLQLLPLFTQFTLI